MIVVDTNIVIHLWTDTDESPAAHNLLRADPEWSAPILWRSELRNMLTLLMLHRSLRMDDAREIAEGAEALMAGREYLVDSPAVLDLAARSGCTAYDCEFVALAQALGVQLVTTDRQILRKFPETARSLRG